MWTTSSVADDVGRQAVVLGHVADALADGGAVGRDVEAEHASPLPDGRREQAEQDLDQRRLAGAVRADEADDPGADVEVRSDTAVTDPKRLVNPVV